jgi:hypothetical protein
MMPLTDKTIRSCFINASLRERQNMILPADLAERDWQKLDFLGWRDRKVPALGYVVVELDDQPTGILLRQVDGQLRGRPQCSWCEDVLLPNDVVFFSAKRAGQAGRNGNTIGTLACAGFECSVNARRKPVLPYDGFDIEAARRQRIESLRARVTAFVRDVRDGR